MGARVWVVVVLFVPVLGWAGRCDPPAQDEPFLRTLPNGDHERREAIGKVLEAGPGDFWLNRLYLDGAVYEPSAIREKYRARFETDGSLENEYLYGRSLVGFDTKKALAIYAEILEKDPDNPWVNNSEMAIYRSPAFHDRAKLRASFEAATRACPEWVEPYRLLTELDDEALGGGAARLWTLLEASSDPRELRLYAVLWAAEFRLKRDGEKERVAADLKRLRAIGGMEATIAVGARLTGDATIQKATAQARPPDLMAVEQAWQRAHPYPKPGDPPEKKRAFAEAELAASAEWIAKDPEAVIEIDLAPQPERTREARMMMAMWHVSALVTLSEYYEKVGRMDEARGVLAPVPGYLARFPVPEGVRDVNGGHNLFTFHALAYYAYWKRMGEIDQRENKREDALNAYREALLQFDVGREDLLARQRRLWKELGRSDEAWQKWVDSIPRPAWRRQGPQPTEAEFAAMHRVVPVVALQDLDGKEWRTDRLAKTTVAVGGR